MAADDSRHSLAQDAPKRPDAEADADFSRDLGVIEAITFVTRACPSGVVVSAAEGALEAIKTKGASEMKNQAYFVLTAIKGWRGDRAMQVHRSLKRYLDEGVDPGDAAPNTADTAEN